MNSVNVGGIGISIIDNVEVSEIDITNIVALHSSCFYLEYL